MNYAHIMASCNSSKCSSVTLLLYKRKWLVFWCCLTVWNFGPHSLVTSGILITRLASFSLFCVFPHSSAQLKGAIFVESIKLLLAPATLSSLSPSLLRPSSVPPPISSILLFSLLPATTWAAHSAALFLTSDSWINVAKREGGRSLFPGCSTPVKPCRVRKTQRVT